MQSIGSFAGLNIGTTALQAATMGENVVGNNIANADTPGYSDESLILSTSLPDISPDMTQGAAELGYIGTGVTTVGVTQANADYLNAQVYTANADVADQTAQQNQLNTVQSAFNEPGSTTINTQLSQFFDNFSAIATDPTSSGVLETAIQGGVSLAQMFNEASSQLTSTQTSVNTAITNDETQINQYGQQLAQLNASIVEGTTPAGQPNSLIDQRNEVLSELSKLVNISVQNNSNNSINVQIGGTVLVNGANNYTVSAATMASRGDITSGDLGGLEATATNITGYQSQLNTLASQVISQVNTLHEAGYSSNGTTNLPFFTGTDASNIAVNTTLVNNPDDLAVASSLPAGSTTPAAGDATNATAIANLGTATLGASAGALSGQTFSGYYNALITQIGSTASTATSSLATATATQTQLTNQQNSITGVNQDDELTNMMEYQRMYQAASEFISTQNTMLDDLISTMFTLT